jgi:hypothetical protein
LNHSRELFPFPKLGSTDTSLWSPHGLKPVAPPHASQGTLNAFINGLKDRGFLRRRVKKPAQEVNKVNHGFFINSDQTHLNFSFSSIHEEAETGISIVMIPKT